MSGGQRWIKIWKTRSNTARSARKTRKWPPPVPLQPWEWPNRPWSRLHLDFAGPFMGRMFLVMVDAHTKWLEAHVLKNITASVTVDTLCQVFSVHGLPDVVVTDNGPTFTGEMFQEFVKRNGISTQGQVLKLTSLVFCSSIGLLHRLLPAWRQQRCCWDGNRNLTWICCIRMLRRK